DCGEATANDPAHTISPQFDPRTNPLIALSISSPSRTLTGLNPPPTDDPAAWTAMNKPIPTDMAGSRMTATRVMLGAICLRSSSHLPPKLYSCVENPVALPPGRARLSTKPAATGSATAANTIGTARVVSSNGATAATPFTRMTSGASATNSAACLRISAGLLVAQRVSIRTFWPMVQPDCSLIPGFGVKLSAIILAGPTVLSAVGACPPHDGVRRRWWINVAGAVSLIESSQKIGRSHHRHRPGRDVFSRPA